MAKDIAYGVVDPISHERFEESKSSIVSKLFGSNNQQAGNKEKLNKKISINKNLNSSNNSIINNSNNNSNKSIFKAFFGYKDEKENDDSKNNDDRHYENKNNINDILVVEINENKSNENDYKFNKNKSNLDIYKYQNENLNINLNSKENNNNNIIKEISEKKDSIIVNKNKKNNFDKFNYKDNKENIENKEKKENKENKDKDNDIVFSFLKCESKSKEIQEIIKSNRISSKENINENIKNKNNDKNNDNDKKIIFCKNTNNESLIVSSNFEDKIEKKNNRNLNLNLNLIKPVLYLNEEEALFEEIYKNPQFDLNNLDNFCLDYNDDIFNNTNKKTLNLNMRLSESFNNNNNKNNNNINKSYNELAKDNIKNNLDQNNFDFGITDEDMFTIIYDNNINKSNKVINNNIDYKKNFYEKNKNEDDFSFMNEYKLGN